MTTTTDAPTLGAQSEQHGLVAHSHGAGAPPPAVSRASRTASHDVADFPVPTGREEEWRFTPMDRVGALLHPAEAPASLDVAVRPAAGVEHRLLERGEAPRGAAFTPTDRIAAVASADAERALLVSVPAELQADAPTFVDLRGTGGRASSHVVVDAGRFSRAVVVLDRTGSAVHGGGVEILVGDGAELTVVSVQAWDDDAVDVSQHVALVGRDAKLRHIAVSLGGSVVRLSTDVRYAGPGGDVELLGVCFADAGQHLEHRLFVDHGAPHCKSRVTYKGALQGETARTVWVGDVLIRAAAEGTDTYELNRNLVLTDGARADSVPNLEIETGEIEGAGHASATGRFDDEQLFYLQARGIPTEVARRLVVRGFFAEVVQQIGVPEVTERVMAAIDAELEAADRAAAGTAAAASEGAA